MRSFHLQRDVDVTGVSGTGIVAEGVLFSNGVACVRWLGEFSTSVFHERGLESIEAIHLSHGGTTIVWHGPHDQEGLNELHGALADRLNGLSEHPGYELATEAMDVLVERRVVCAPDGYEVINGHLVERNLDG